LGDEDRVTETGQRQGWWATVREAIRGSHHDYTSGPIGRAIVLLAIPMVMEMVMESVFAVVDVFWVAHLGPNAVATVGLTESMLALVYTAAMGLSIGDRDARALACQRHQYPARSLLHLRARPVSGAGRHRGRGR
jgi:hypothetical protein